MDLDAVQNINTITDKATLKVEQTKHTIIRQLSANIAQLEARVKMMEDKERENIEAHKVITNRITEIEKTNSNTMSIPAQPTIGQNPNPTTIPARPTIGQNMTPEPSMQNQPVKTGQVDNEGFIIYRNRKHRHIPTVGISPGEGPVADTNTIPPISYSNVHLQPRQPKPRESIPEKLLNMTAESDTELEEDDTNSPSKMDTDDKNKLADHVEESKLIIGFKPITNKTLEEEAAEVASTANLEDRKDRSFIMKTAAINSVTRFLKEHLKMSERDRNELQIDTVFQSNTLIPRYSI